MTRTEIRWVIAVPDAAGILQLFRLAPLGAALEFTAPDRQSAERMILASGASLPDDAVLMSRLEFEELQRSSSVRFVAPPVRLARTIGLQDITAENSRLYAERHRSRAVDVPPLRIGE